MINLDEVVKAIAMIIKGNQFDIISTINIDKNHYPNYDKYSPLTPEICKNLKNRKQCQEFYNSLEHNDKNYDCPFGIKIKLNSFKASNKTLTLVTQLSHSPKNIDTKKIFYLPRKSKKSIKRKLKKIDFSKYSTNTARQIHLVNSNLLEALLYGRVALSMKGISHQLFTPLQGAMADYENIKKKDDIVESIERLGNNLSSINNLAQQIQVLLSDEIEFSKNMLRKVNISKLIKTIIQELESSAEDKFILFEQSYNNISKTIDAIPQQLNLVFSNILQNALKYSFKGFQDHKLKIKIDYLGEADFLIVNIRNEGIQISEEEIKFKKLFELGYRGKFSLDRNRTGTGVGLHIANQIVEAHGGKIEVFSQVAGESQNPETQKYYNDFKIYWPIHHNDSL